MDNVQNYIATNGVSLESLGVNNYALNKTNALRLLDLLAEQKVAVLGGDVYVSKNNQLSLTYDNWYSDKDSSESDEAFCSRSILESEKYIKNYANADAFFAFTLD